MMSKNRFNDILKTSCIPILDMVLSREWICENKFKLIEESVFAAHFTLDAMSRLRVDRCGIQFEKSHRHG